MRPSQTKQCIKCQATAEERFLEICSICRNATCRVCAAHRHGKRFCSVHCADLFFFGDEDSQEEDWG